MKIQKGKIARLLDLKFTIIKDFLIQKQITRYVYYF